MKCAKNKVTYSTMGVLRVKNPAKELNEIVTVIDYPRDMNQVDNLMFSLVLDLDIRSFNMLSMICRMTGIDNVDAGFIVFIDQSRTSP